MGIIDKLRKKRGPAAYKICEDVAFDQFDLLISHYGLDHMIDKVDILDRRERNQVEIEMELVIEDIKKGFISIEETDKGLEIIQTLSSGETFTYKELDGKIPQMKARFKDETEQIWSVMGYLSGQGIDIIKKLKRKDLAVTQRIGSFLFNA